MTSTPSPPKVAQIPAPLDFNNIQGDILAGLPKKVEAYSFFRIKHVDDFRSQLFHLLPLITTTAQVLEDQVKISRHKKHGSEKGKLLKISGFNLAFSQKGLETMNIGKATGDRIGDPPFEAGMKEDKSLGDDLDNWNSKFKDGELHGLIVVTGDCQSTLEEKLSEVKAILDTSIEQVTRIDGKVRPGSEDGHEHFGYLDGVSQPAVLGVDQNLHRGQESVRQGIILLGREGDNFPDNDRVNPPGSFRPRPDWAIDGSFLCFRLLEQKVPEFDNFVQENQAKEHPEAAPDLFGARLVGRWKSGAPIDVTPLQDDKELGRDPTRNDDFRYDPFSQSRCPFAAHTRKTNPRSDLSTTEIRRILRRGIPFGPEVTKAERAAGKTTKQRGLLFKAYQSNITNGFQFIQSSWANNPGFPFLFDPRVAKPGFTPFLDSNLKPNPDFTPDKGPGFDAIVGQAGKGKDRVIDIKGGSDPAGKFTLKEEWVISRGGEYFFSPSLSALEEKFAKEKGSAAPAPARSAPGHDL